MENQWFFSPHVCHGESSPTDSPTLPVPPSAPFVGDYITVGRWGCPNNHLVGPSLPPCIHTSGELGVGRLFAALGARQFFLFGCWRGVEGKGTFKFKPTNDVIQTSECRWLFLGSVIPMTYVSFFFPPRRLLLLHLRGGVVFVAVVTVMWRSRTQFSSRWNWKDTRPSSICMP